MSKSTTPLKNKKFQFSDIPDQSNKVILVTGANRGLGYIISRELAFKNASVVMTCRKLADGEKAKQTILELQPNAHIDVMELDLASLESIRNFSCQFNQKYSKLDVLMNNAGVTARVKLPPNAKTDDGFEYYLGVNHFGTFALTGQLIELLLKTENAKIITVSSLGHRQGKIHFEDLTKTRSSYNLYGQSKLANLLFTYELARKIENKKIPLKSIAVHPGFSRTTMHNAGFFYKLGRKFLSQSAEDGSLPLLYTCVAEDVQNGDFIGPNGFYGIKGYPKRVKSNKRSYNEKDAKKLWEISEELTKVRYPF